ncbi:MAG: hypothetical protein RL072_1759 [Actinomycetota bacterium]
MISARSLGGQKTLLVASFVAFLAVLLGRSAHSLTRLPADPGYTYIEDAVRDGLRSIFYGDPYFHVLARGLAWLTSLAPLQWHAALLSSLVHFVWAMSAVCIVWVISLEKLPKWVAVLAGFLLVSAPHAAESSLGNVGNVKWPILAAAIVVCSSRQVAQLSKPGFVVLLLTAGFTQPMTLICVIPLLRLSFEYKELRHRTLTLASLILATFALQLTKVGLSSASSGRSGKVLTPWTDMGIFWWSGLLGPLTVSVASFALLLVGKRQSIVVRTIATDLGFLSILLAGISYVMGGIADRYFVAPMTLALICGLLAVCDLKFTHPHLKRVVSLALLVVILIPTTKWFPTSPYLSSGPPWSAEVSKARGLCSRSSIRNIEIQISAGSFVTLDCEFILRG